MILWPGSFGGVAAARLLAERTILNVVGFMGHYPVLDLAAMYANPDAAFSTAIDAACGSLAAAQAAGAYPALMPAAQLRGCL